MIKIPKDLLDKNVLTVMLLYAASTFFNILTGDDDDEPEFLHMWADGDFDEVKKVDEGNVSIILFLISIMRLMLVV